MTHIEVVLPNGESFFMKPLETLTIKVTRHTLIPAIPSDLREFVEAEDRHVITFSGVGRREAFMSHEYELKEL